MGGRGSGIRKGGLRGPTGDRAAGQARLDAIATLRGPNGAGPWHRLREQLKGSSDVERITARIALRQVRPRELVALQQTLQKAELLAPVLPAQTALLVHISALLRPPADCMALLQRAILEEPAALVRDGGVIANGFDAELDELRAIQTNCDAFLLDLATRERASSGIANLRVQFNKVHGFYIEVTQGQVDKVPDDYRRRQTLKNAERFITPELKAFEDKALSAQERALAREKWLFEQVLDALQAHIGALGQLARALATLDVLCALTERSLTLNWCAPIFVKEPCIDIEKGRHPVVEARLAGDPEAALAQARAAVAAQPTEEARTAMRGWLGRLLDRAGRTAEALAHWEASRVSATLALTPLVTFVSVALASTWWPDHVLPEQVNWIAYAGAVVVVLGSALTALGPWLLAAWRARRAGR